MASVPQGSARRTRPRRRLPYLGPPSYNSAPRWGFPALAWRWPTTVPGTRSADGQPVTVDRVRAVAGHAAALMWALAALSVLAAGGEAWRYALLLRSRNGALSDRLVATSDAVVTVAAVLALSFLVLSAVVTLWWLHLARHAAADQVDQRLARPDWHVLGYLLFPGVNLVMAGVLMAELEHTVLRRPADERPRPTRATKVWWAAWVLSGLLFAVTVVWRFRDSVQAHADGVVLSGLTDLAAAAMAALTAIAVRRLSTLLAPIDPRSVRFMRVIRVDGAPEPPLRKDRLTPSRR